MMTKAFVLVLFYTIGASTLWCQIEESFSDGSLAADPYWQGDTSDFSINKNFELQLMADSAGASFIYTGFTLSQNADWSIDFRLTFDPSTSNQLRIYLYLDSENLAQANGYYIELGESGNDDRLKFYNISGGVSQLLSTGTSSFSSSPAVRMHCTLRESIWAISSIDPDGNHHEEMVIDGISGDLAGTGYFGLLCKYSATRKDQFIFDNILVEDPNMIDVKPPRLLDVEISNPRQLILSFSEALESSSAEHSDNYSLEALSSPGFITLNQALLLADPSMVQLDLRQPLTNGEAYQLYGKNIRDTSGNAGAVTWKFTYLLRQRLEAYNVLINEIFDDPNPPAGLPNAEYLELLTLKPNVNLGDLILKVGTKEISLPDQIMQRGDFVVLHDPAEESEFSEVSGSLALEGWSTLVNSGNDLQLVTTDGRIIHSVSYQDSWYRHSTKAQGGWALELINPKDPCALAENWRVSENLSGGTPGFENSVLDSMTSLIDPGVVSVLTEDSTTIRLILNKNYLEDLAPTTFSLSGQHEVITAVVSGPNQNEITLVVFPAMRRDEEYTLSFPGLSDCSSTAFSMDPVGLVLPSLLAPGDLVISEVLFNPKPGGYDFIEFYNASDKSYLLSDLIIGNLQNQDTEKLNQAFTILPGMYVVLTRDPIQLSTRYQVPHPHWVVETALPNFNDALGNVTLFTSRGGKVSTIDAFDYTADMHSRLLKDPEGVSLERIDLTRTAQDRSNWHSAAGSAGFATPTGKNSQFRSEGQSGHWEVEPRIFSPDGDGYDDFALLSYREIETGTYAHIKIYDAAGRLVSYLANNQSLSTSGFIQWDGSTDQGTRAPMGIYTFFIELFNLTGRIDQFKASCVLAMRLD
ncbi:MAG: hypothetical protein HKN76_00350 [Saprospiraceae bacterium]|nr:hypothetical protein [Saprospiraceae bacterium]